MLPHWSRVTFCLFGVLHLDCWHASSFLFLNKIIYNNFQSYTVHKMEKVSLEHLHKVQLATVTALMCCASYLIYIMSFQITFWPKLMKCWMNHQHRGCKCTQGSSTPAVDCVLRAADWDTLLQLISNKWVCVRACVCVWTLRKWAVLSQTRCQSIPTALLSPSLLTPAALRDNTGFSGTGSILLPLKGSCDYTSL